MREVKRNGSGLWLFYKRAGNKKLLSAQRKMAAKGNAKGLIAVTKFILSISHQFDGEMLKISQGINIDGRKENSDKKYRHPPGCFSNAKKAGGESE